VKSRKRPMNPLTDPFNPRMASALARIFFFLDGRPLPDVVIMDDVQIALCSKTNFNPGRVAHDWHTWIGLLCDDLSPSEWGPHATYRDKLNALLATLMEGPFPLADICLAAEHQAALEEMYDEPDRED